MLLQLDSEKFIYTKITSIYSNIVLDSLVTFKFECKNERSCLIYFIVENI